MEVTKWLKPSISGHLLVAAALHQHIENLALVIDGSSQVHPFAGDANHHLLEVPPVAWSWAAPSKPAGEPGPELQNPPPHGFIGNLQAPLGQEILHIAIAQGEAQVEPDRVLDDRRRKAVSAIGKWGHTEMLSDPGLALDPLCRDNASGIAFGGAPLSVVRAFGTTGWVN